MLEIKDENGKILKYKTSQVPGKADYNNQSRFERLSEIALHEWCSQACKTITAFVEENIDKL